MKTNSVNKMLKPYEMVAQLEQATGNEAKVVEQKLQDFETGVKAAMRTEENTPDAWGFVKKVYSPNEEAAIMNFNKDKRFTITE